MIGRSGRKPNRRKRGVQARLPAVCRTLGTGASVVHALDPSCGLGILRCVPMPEARLELLWIHCGPSQYLSIKRGNEE